MELYAVIDQVRNGDEFVDWYDTLEAAVAAAENEWHHMTDYDRKRSSAFYVLKSCNPDPDAPDHYDGDTVREWVF